jgi:hydrogenase-4 membrane subunit HyfE
VIGAAGAATLLLSVALLCVKRIDTAAWACALQALCAAMPLGESAAAVAVLAFALNGVMLPLALVRMNDGAMPALRHNALLVWAMALALLVVIISVAANIGAGEIMPAGVSVTLLGVLLAVLRSDTWTPALGLLSSQNGLVLVAGASPDLSGMAAFAVAVPLVPGLVLAGMRLRR